MIDISQNELYIIRYERAHKDYIPPISIPFCRPRLYDGFIYILGGSCLYTFSDGKQLEAREGDVLYLSMGSVYKMDVRGRYDFICINLVLGSDELRNPDVFTPKDRDKCENLFFKAWKNNTGATLSSRIAVAYRIYNEIILSKKEAYLQEGTRAKIEEAISSIYAEFGNEISVSHLAHTANMSEVYFRRLFKSITGTSPARFIINCRVTRAKELLIEEYLTLEDISERCGFSTPSYFCRVFKEITGMTPNEFRCAARD